MCQDSADFGCDSRACCLSICWTTCFIWAFAFFFNPISKHLGLLTVLVLANTVIAFVFLYTCSRGCKSVWHIWHSELSGESSVRIYRWRLVSNWAVAAAAGLVQTASLVCVRCNSQLIHRSLVYSANWLTELSVLYYLIVCPVLLVRVLSIHSVCD